MFAKRQGEEKQQEFWIERTRVSKPPSQGFYSKLNEHLAAMDFARRVWALCEPAYRADPLTCPDCGAEMRILAFIEEDRVIGRILRHLGLLPDASRGPPLQEPVYEPIYNDLPAVEERKTLSASPSERPKSLRRRPVLASWRPARPPGSPKRARTSERSPKRR